MKYYRTNDGARVAGRTSREVIKALRASSWHPEHSHFAFMHMTATRVKQQTGVVVPTNTEAGFVAGLVQAGLLKPTEENEC